MRHKNGIKKLSKPTDQRIALLRSLVLSLLTYNKIKTTHKRAMEAKRMAEKLITLSKSNSLSSRRQALRILPNEQAITHLFSQSSSRFQSRDSGYTRVIKLHFRKGDFTPVSLLEFVE